MQISRSFASLLVLALAACGGGNSSSPGTPVAGGTPPPTPAPTPTPVANAFAAACGTPLPAFKDSYGYGIKVQLEPSKLRKVLNASPQVRNEEYCRQTGLFGQFCNTRLETNPERVPCDHYLSGISDTGMPGPNWYQQVDGKLLKCPGDSTPGDAPGCHLKAENQYLLDIRQGGVYKACGGTGSPGTCGVCVIDDSTFGTTHQSTGGLCKVGDI